MRLFSRFGGLSAACACHCLTLAAGGQVFSTESGWSMWLDAVSSAKERISVNNAIGADAAYSQNLFGQGVRVANIEPGLLWNGHVLFRRVPASHLYTGVEAVPNHVDPHATGVCGVLAGDSGVYDARNKGMGIAPGADLYSASFYTEPVAGGAPFTHTSLITTFRKFFGWADVINTSWGTVWPERTLEYYSYLTDALCRRHPDTVFFAASGNTGNLPDENLKGKVSTIASGFNNIAVGAMGNPPAFDRLYVNGSFKPVDFINPETNRREGERAGVDIVAPGEGLVVPAMVPQHPEKADAAMKSAGTSLACPVAAGAGALLVQAAKKAGLKAPVLDARLIKALLLNAAAKPKDWQNGMNSSTRAGRENVLLTTQALDYRYGAGMVDAGEALRLLAAGRDRAWQRAAMLPGGEAVQNLGALSRGNTVTATLVWFQDCVIRGIDSIPEDRVLSQQIAQKGRDPLGRPELEYRGLADYALELWSGSPGDIKTARLVAVSDTPNNTVEHFKVIVPSDGNYFLRVVFKDMTYGSAPKDGESSVWVWSVR